MEQDRTYCQKRAEAELKMARAARNAEAGRVHYTLAGHYLDRAHGDDASRPAVASPIGHD